MDSFQVISFSYKNLPLSLVGKVAFSEEKTENILSVSKKILGCKEVFCLSTCNRTEWIFYGQIPQDKPQIIHTLISSLFNLQESVIEILKKKVEWKTRDDAVLHVFRLCSSLESMVIGERDILAQVRKAYDVAWKNHFISDRLRILMRCATECAKEVYTQTKIAEKPVSVASLAYRELLKKISGNQNRFLVIGAGETNWKLLDYLKKNPGHSYFIYNRTPEKARELAERVKGQFFPLQHLSWHSDPFDAILLCTSSPEPIITLEIAEKVFPLFQNEPVIVDLSVPSGIHPDVVQQYNPFVIQIEGLERQVEQNRKEREKEIENCEKIIQQYFVAHRKLQMERTVELMLGEIPQKIRETKEKALNEVFKNEISCLNEESRDVLLKVLDYMEKKYNSFTFRSAKELLLKDEVSDIS